MKAKTETAATAATETTATTSLAVRETAPMFVVPVNTVGDLESIGGKYAQSGFFGQITASQGFLVATSQREEGLSVTEWLQRHQVIGNTISWKPNWMLGEFKRRGGKVHIVRADREVCEIEFTHWDGETLTGKLTLDEMKQTSVPFAKDGKTLKTNWQNFADDMLFARVCGKSLRRLCPEVFFGMYTDGEAQDFDRAPVAAAPRTVTPTSVSPSPVAEADAQAVDYGICPCGSVKGKRWGEIPTEMLEKIVATPEAKAKSITQDHRNAIVAELARREAVEAGEVVEPEIVEG